MNNTKKIYSTALLSALFLFSGCITKNEIENKAMEPQENNINLQNIVSEVQNRSAYFSLEQKNGNTVALVLNNPKEAAIQSFTSEIIFPPHLVHIKNLENTSEDIFGLYMQSDWKIDNDKGRIKMAAASLGSAQKVLENRKKTITVAQFEVEKIRPENTFILDINENISNILVINKNKNKNKNADKTIRNNSEQLKSIVNKNRTKDLIIK